MDNKIIIAGVGLGLLYLYSQNNVSADDSLILTSAITKSGTQSTHPLDSGQKTNTIQPSYNLFEQTTALSPTRFLTSGDAVYDRYEQQTISKSQASERYTSSQIQKILTPTVYPQSKQIIPQIVKKSPSASTPTTTTKQNSIISQLPSFRTGKLIFPK